MNVDNLANNIRNQLAQNYLQNNAAKNKTTKPSFSDSQINIPRKNAYVCAGIGFGIGMLLYHAFGNIKQSSKSTNAILFLTSGVLGAISALGLGTFGSMLSEEQREIALFATTPLWAGNGINIKA